VKPVVLSNHKNIYIGMAICWITMFQPSMKLTEYASVYFIFHKVRQADYQDQKKLNCLKVIFSARNGCFCQYLNYICDNKIPFFIRFVPDSAYLFAFKF